METITTIHGLLVREYNNGSLCRDVESEQEIEAFLAGYPFPTEGSLKVDLIEITDILAEQPSEAVCKMWVTSRYFTRSTPPQQKKVSIFFRKFLEKKEYKWVEGGDPKVLHVLIDAIARVAYLDKNPHLLQELVRHRNFLESGKYSMPAALVRVAISEERNHEGLYVRKAPWGSW